MINVPESFKIDLRTYGRQFNIKLKVNNSDFNADNLNSIKPSFTTPLFKTIMHQIELDSKVYMPKDTKISGRIGIKVNEKVYKYIDLNTYYVHTCERQEDTNSYRIIAYTKMKEAMIDYDLELAEKLTARNYLIAICERLGWNTDNIPATFINSEKMVDPNLHTGIKYSFRDALDELATITCSFLFFNGDNFYLKYFNEAICYQEKSGQNITFQSELKSMIKLKKLEGKSTQATRDGKNKFNLDYIRDSSVFIKTDTGVNLVNAWVVDVYTFENIIKTFKPSTTYTMRVKAKVVSRPSTILYHNDAIFYFYRQRTSTLGAVGVNVLLMSDKETVALGTEKEYITTFTTPEDMTDVRFVSYTFNGNNDGSTTGSAQGKIDVSEIMLVEGTYTAENFPDFELYGVSRSPDYPSKIKSIGDEGTLNIEQSGKNKLINSSFRENWTDWWTSALQPEITEKLGQKCLHIAGELQKTKTVAQSIQKKVEVGKTYTLSCMAYLKDYVAGTTNPIISFYTDGKTTDGSWTSGIQTLKGYLNFNNSNYDYSKGFVKMTSTFKIKDDTDLTKTLGLYVYARDFTGDLYVYDVQLEEGTETTDYEEYFNKTYTLPLSEPLRSLPNGVKDTLENDGIHRFINHRIFDGSNDEKWYIGRISSDTAKTDIYIVLLDDNYNQGIGVSILSDYFENKVVWNTDTEGIYLQANNGALMVRINKDRLENPGTTPSFKKWLSQNPIPVQYQARTEKTENYTDEQKEVLNSMITEKGTNIFKFENQAQISCPLEIQEIDETYLDEDNVTIGEKHFINSLVFSRAEESDNICKKDGNSITENGLHEYRIADCQLLSTNDRSDYIDEMFNYLKTLEFYIFDIQSKGILFLEACDLFNLKLNNVTYKTVLLNDEINIDDGLTENLYLDKPEETETEYKYADETDKKIDQTNFIVNKQEKKIQGLISQIGDRSEKTTTITADIDGLNSKVEEIATLINTVTGKRVNLENCAYSEIGELVITGDVEVLTLADDVIGHYGTVPMPNLAPLGTLAPSKPQKQSKAVYVSDNTYLLDTTLIHIKPDNTTVKISLPDFILRTLGETKDEFHIKDGKAYVIQKIELDAAGYKYILDEPKTIELGTIELILEEGTNTLYMEGFPNATLTAIYMIKNELSDNFATKVELSTSIKQTSTEIMSEVNKKVDEEEFGTKIVQDYQSVQIAWNKIDELIQFIDGKLKILNQSKQTLMTLDKLGQHFFSNNNEFGNMGINVVDNKKYISFSVDGEYGSNTNNGMAWGVTTKSDNKFFPILFIENFNVAQKDADDYGGQLVLTACDLVLQGIGTGIISGNVKMYGNDLTNGLIFEDTATQETLLEIIPDGSTLYTYPRIRFLDGAIDFFRNQAGSNSFKIGNSLFTDEDDLIIGNDNNNGSITVHGNVYANNISSDKRIKENIQDSDINALEIIKKIKHKQFYKKDDKKHYDIGYIAQDMEEIDSNFVIKREKTEYEEERYYINELPIIATLSKAIQEQQEIIEQLQNKINELEEKIND